MGTIRPRPWPELWLWGLCGGCALAVATAHGGELISSVELENLLVGSPGVLEAAVIGIPDDKWTERPLACVVVSQDTDPVTLAESLVGKVAHWQIPENWAFIEEVPKTTVGKFDKKVLRARYRDGDLDVKRTRD